jgi:amino acid transporter
LENPISALKAYITRYISLRIQEVRLEALERVVNVMGYLVYASIAFVIFFAMFCFSALGLAEFLSALFDSKTAGYLSIAGLMLLFLCIMFFFKKNIMRFLAGKFIWLLTKPRDDDDDDAPVKSDA